MHDRDALTQTWLKAERDAAAAELELASYGQVAATPEYRDKAVRATQLRRTADDLFRHLHALLNGKAPPTP